MKRLSPYAPLALLILLALYPLSQVITLLLGLGQQLPHTPLLGPVDDRTMSTPSGFFSNPSLRFWLGSATLVSLSVALTAVVLSSFGGYVLSRRGVHAGRALSRSRAGWAVTPFFVGLILLLLLYVTLVPLHRINPFIGVMIVHTITVLPFCVWLMKNAYDAIPTRMEDTAKLDGCGPWQTFFRVILPLAAPRVAATALFAFVAAWNECVLALAILRDARRFALPKGIETMVFPGGLSLPWALYGIALLVACVPLVSLLWAASGRFSKLGTATVERL